MSNALKDLFQEQADAIREGLGNIGGIAPNETPALIREIVSMIGTGGGGGGAGSGLKFATGTFNTGTTGIYRQTITHGLGVMPDFVMVYVDVLLVPTTSAEVIEKYPLQCVWGLHSKFASKAGVAGYYNVIGIAPANNSGFLDVKKNEAQIYCPDDATFEFGLSSGTNGLLYEDMKYSWIAISGMATGGGSSADVRYVTFMNGNVELYRKPVAVGDDCVDVLSKGLISTPTKESDAQYHYTYYGWGAEDGGAADANILKNITEDKTVYAVFSKTLRSYTITYYDDDGITVLKTETLAYGARPSYTPIKEGYILDGWEPALAMVTGDASYVVKWAAGYKLANYTWAQIANFSKNGQANLFTIGDTKEVKLANNMKALARLVGINHDDLADGSGKAGMTFLLQGFYYDKQREWGSGSYGNDYQSWGESVVRTSNLPTLWLPHCKPTEIDNVKRTVTKKFYNAKTSAYETVEDTYFLPSLSELNYEQSGRTEEGAAYPWFVENGRIVKNEYDNVAVQYWTRTKSGSSKKVYVVGTNGAVTTATQTTTGTYNTYFLVCI